MHWVFATAASIRGGLIVLPALSVTGGQKLGQVVPAFLALRQELVNLAPGGLALAGVARAQQREQLLELLAEFLGGGLGGHRLEFSLSRHTGTLVPNQPHVSAQCLSMCRSKPLIQRRCAGVPSN